MAIHWFLGKSLASFVVFLVPTFSFRSCMNHKKKEISEVSKMMQLPAGETRHQYYASWISLHSSIPISFRRVTAHLVVAVSVPVPFSVS
jgi:hypothetical protein